MTAVIQFSMPVYQDGGTTGPNPKYQYSAITTGDANDLCEASLQITPPPDNLYYSKTDESYLSFEYTFDPVCECDFELSDICKRRLADRNTEKGLGCFSKLTLATGVV